MSALRSNPWWPTAMSNLETLVAKHGDEAKSRAQWYSEVYSGQRAAMVYDVVASRQRRYQPRVLGMVQRFRGSVEAQSLSHLAAAGPDIEAGLREGEADTMRNVAAGLADFCTQHDLNEDVGVRTWAEAVADLEHAHRMDPYAGSVTGMGPALFAYLRMRSGADTIKPDLRVKAGLQRLGFAVPSEPHALLVVATAAALDLGLPRLVLDQLLWWSDSVTDLAAPARADDTAGARVA